MHARHRDGVAALARRRQRGDGVGALGDAERRTGAVEPALDGGVAAPCDEDRAERRRERYRLAHPGPETERGTAVVHPLDAGLAARGRGDGDARRGGPRQLLGDRLQGGERRARDAARLRRGSGTPDRASSDVRRRVARGPAARGPGAPSRSWPGARRPIAPPRTPRRRPRGSSPGDRARRRPSARRATAGRACGAPELTVSRRCR